MQKLVVERISGGGQRSLRLNDGFTLAEILITLTIIGVVASMTLPAIIQKNTEKTTVARLKKAYSTLSQAYLGVLSNDGSPDEWNLPYYMEDDGGQYILDKFKPWLKIIKDCGTREKGCYSEGNEDTQKETAAKVVLNDGTCLSFKVWQEQCMASFGNVQQVKNICGIIEVDVNCLKTPNKSGQDIFRFFLTKDRIFPYGTALQDSGDLDNPHRLSFAYCAKHKGGLGCTAWVLYNENMDYLRCSDLSWDGKKKCK